MPRYFTFSALLFVLLQQGKIQREPCVWHIPGFWRSLLFVVLVETHAFHTSFWDGTNHLTRIGLSLVASQLVWPAQMNWKRVGRDTFKWGGMLAVGALFATLGTQLSITDLVLFALNPMMHPTGTVFFTFLSGLGLGFVTGNFAIAFFTLYTALSKSASIPVVQAALLDGIVAGILLSPVSVLNLLPAVQFGLSVKTVVVHRFRQLAFPLIIGLLIYAVSAITSVAILRPATFVFLCLVAVVIQLRKSSWKFGNYTISLSSHNAEH
jgi:hypothetical protein